MTVEKIKMFLAICIEGSTLKAAESLHITQPAISQGIKDLEFILDIKLFERVGRRLVLSEDGRKFLPYAQQYKQSHDQAFHLFRDVAATITVGSSITIAEYILPNMVISFEAHSSSRVELYINNVKVMKEMMEHNEIDAAFMEGNIDSIDYTYYPLGEFHLEFVASPKYLENKSGELEEYDFLTREYGSSYRVHFDSFCRKNGVLKTPKWESVSNEVLKEAALNHQGIALLPNELIHTSLKNGELNIVELGEEKLKEPYGFIVHKLREGDLPIAEFIKHILKDTRA